MKQLFIFILFVIVITSIVHSLPNPSAVLCGELEYDYEMDETESGQMGICVFPDGSKCGAWDFYAGKCGQKWTLCEKLGGEISAVNDGQDPYSSTYALCTINNQSCKESEFVETRKCGDYILSGSSLNQSEFPIWWGVIILSVLIILFFMLKGNKLSNKK